MWEVFSVLFEVTIVRIQMKYLKNKVICIVSIQKTEIKRKGHIWRLLVKSIPLIWRIRTLKCSFSERRFHQSTQSSKRWKLFSNWILNDGDLWTPSTSTQHNVKLYETVWERYENEDSLDWSAIDGSTTVTIIRSNELFWNSMSLWNEEKDQFNGRNE